MHRYTIFSSIGFPDGLCKSRHGNEVSSTLRIKVKLWIKFLTILDGIESESVQPVSDPERRKLLLAASSVAGGTALAAASIPFIASMNPSERARAAGAPLTVDFSQLAPGTQPTVEWRGKPV